MYSTSLIGKKKFKLIFKLNINEKSELIPTFALLHKKINTKFPLKLDSIVVKTPSFPYECCYHFTKKNFILFIKKSIASRQDIVHVHIYFVTIKMHYIYSSMLRAMNMPM